MKSRTLAILATTTALLCASHASHAASHPGHCAALPDQSDSKAEILKLEKQWSRAYATGHSDFLECLYAPDFVDFDARGKVHERANDIASSLKNVGKSYTPSGQWVTRVLMHPNYAIATSIKTRATHGRIVTDIYAYDGHRWHAIFSQDANF